MESFISEPEAEYEPSIENSTTCPICSSQGVHHRSIKFEQSYENLCERCSFLRDAVEQSVSANLLVRSGTSHETSWKDSEEKTWQSAAVRGNRWSGFEWRIWEGKLSSKGTRFELFTLEGLPRPFPDFPVKNPPVNTKSPPSFLKVQEWLDICQKSHELCGPPALVPPRLPKRVLDASSTQVRLYEPHNEFDHYVCLSHCWGEVRPACSTTSATIQAKQSGIDWWALPATFRDAIDFTRRLGLRYIWIDALCILQDNIQDWGEQSALSEFSS